MLRAQFSLSLVCSTRLADAAPSLAGPDPPSLDSGEVAEPKGCTVWYVVGGVPTPHMLLVGVFRGVSESPSLFLRRQAVMVSIA